MLSPRIQHILLIILVLISLGSCEKFFYPDQDVFIKEEDFYRDWSEYRAAELGLYSIQQQLVEQLVVLGELRADLLEITGNADRDLIEIYSFQISKDNKYASPVKFYELIGACNSLIVQLETEHPNVLDPEQEIDNYDRLYGEVLCMRAWAYFQAVRIYGKVPYIWQSLTSVEEIEQYVNAGGQYIDSVKIVYAPGGYYNDTLYNDTVRLDNKYLDLSAVIDTFTNQLETRVKVVGVIHNLENLDQTWDVTVWNRYAWHYLLGQMYLYEGNYQKAMSHFEQPFLYNRDSETQFIKFGLDNKFQGLSWKNIFTGIDPYEHILTLWFNKSYQQKNGLQKLFSVLPPNRYMLRPTRIAMDNWETLWAGYELEDDDDPNHPELAKMVDPGKPGDFYRGHRVSYAYIRNGDTLKNSEVSSILDLRRRGLTGEFNLRLSGTDPMVYKYSLGKNPYDQDANYILYRAASAHLYASEIFNRWQNEQSGIIKNNIPRSLAILNNGNYVNSYQQQLGVRGRVGFGGDYGVYVGDIIYRFDPYTNEIIGWYNYRNNLQKKVEYLEDQIINERARELAFEGERFYDLIRIAKRRNDPSYLADRVAAKFTGTEAERIRTLLMDENNWYIPLY